MENKIYIGNLYRFGKENDMESKIYVGTLYRFGYDLTAVGDDELKVREALINEYTTSYIEINGTDPELDPYDEYRSYLEEAIDCIEMMELEPYKVEWR